MSRPHSRSVIFLLLVVSVAAVWLLQRRGGNPPRALSLDEIRSDSLDEETARKVFPILEKRPDLYRYDPVAILVRVPNADEPWDFPEHPTGRIVLRSNNLGLGRDSPTRTAKERPRILVAGDSHTQGMVNNAESFANLLEAKLGSRGDGPWEVLNAGVAFGGPTCYLGTLRKHLVLQPDVFVAVLFSGNDFSDEILIDDFLTGGAGPVRNRRYMAPLEAATAISAGFVYQGANQAYHFAAFPSRARLGLDRAVAAFDAMDRLCRQHGIEFLAVVLPTRPEVDHDDDETVRETLQALALTQEQYGINARLALEFAAALTAKGISCLDSSAALRAAAAADPAFWRRDYHLSTVGHSALAEQLHSQLAPVLAVHRAARRP